MGELGRTRNGPRGTKGREEGASAPVPSMDYRFRSGSLLLSGHLAVPPSGVEGAPGLVLCHGFPTRGRESPQSGQSFPELAERIATELGWLVLTMNFRGCGASEGQFSLDGWLEDVHAAVDHLLSLGADGVWLAGFGTGGSLVVSEGARNPAVRGVAAMATPGDFDDWARNPRRLLIHARQVHVIKDPAFPQEFDKWAAALKKVRPVDAAAQLAPRPLLVMHGDSDDLTPLADGRALVAAHGEAEFRLISGAGHELRHDPRAVAVFLGWLARQQIEMSVSAAGRSADLQADTDLALRTAEMPAVELPGSAPAAEVESTGGDDEPAGEPDE